MKKILFIAFLFFGVYANAQKVKAEVIELDTLTTTERNALTVPAGKVQVVYDETIGDFYVNVKNGGWVTLASLVGGLANVVEDITPQLGGDLDAQSIYDIINLVNLGVQTVNVSANLNVVGNTTSNTIIFTENDTPPTIGEGVLYADDSENRLKYDDGTGYRALAFQDELGGGSSLPVSDATSLVEDPVDGTKEMRIDVGAVSTATIRTLTMPDADVDLGGLTASNLATGSVTTDEILNGTIALADMASNSVSTSQIVDGSITAGDISNGVIDNTKLATMPANTIKGNNTGGAANADDLTVAEVNAMLGSSDDQTAAEVTSTATGTVAATNVDAAIAELASEKINTTISGRTGTAINSAQFETDAQITSNGAVGTNELVICSDCSPAEVVATATIAMDGWKMYDDQTADAATITLSDCDPGETLTVYINRASAPTLAGTGLTFNQLPNTTAFAAATTMMIIFEVAYDGTTIDYYYVER